MSPADVACDLKVRGSVVSRPDQVGARASHNSLLATLRPGRWTGGPNSTAPDSTKAGQQEDPASPHSSISPTDVVKARGSSASKLDRVGLRASSNSLLPALRPGRWAGATRRLSKAVSFVAPTRVEASLLHAITTQTLLSQCGAAFRSQEFHVEEHYHKSFETDRLGDFVSHDWASSRLGKLFALGLVYNSQAALIASGVTALVLAYLQYGPEAVLPPPSFVADKYGQTAASFGVWCMIISPFVGILFFLFWQDVRTLLNIGTKSCFLDKYCIDQANPERKAAGILGLAGFLRCSDRIIILWTPRYFTRLWCTYEVASWLHLQKPLTSVLFLPLAHANIIVTLWLAGWVSFLMLLLGVIFLPEYYMHLVAAGLLAGLSVGAHQARHCARHLRAIPEQLRNFAVTSANCFCCSSGHIGTNGKPIPCDRDVVYTTIAEWFNNVNDDASVTTEDRLDRFDQAVRTHFAAQVLEKAGPTQLAYRYTVVAGWTYFYRLADLIAAADKMERVVFYNSVLMYSIIFLFATPMWYKVTMNITCVADARIGIPRLKILDYCTSFVFGLLFTLVALIVYVPLLWLATNSTSVLPLLCIAVCFALANLRVFSADVRECCCQWRAPAEVPTTTTFAIERAEHEDEGGKDMEEKAAEEGKAEKGEHEGVFTLDDSTFSIHSI